MSVAVLSIGTEITRGEIVNTNAAWLCEEITRVGLDVRVVDTVPDDRAAIVEALRRLSTEHAFIVCTGGLGPTTDDITTECVAVALGVPMERDATSIEAIQARLARYGRTLSDSNAKQADFPRGATVLPNANGTAPGFSVALGNARAFFMPGVPSEMKHMFEASVLPVLRAGLTGGLHQVRLKTFGLPESTVNDRLAGIEAEHDVIIGYRAHFPEIEVKVLARRASADEASIVSRRAADLVRQRLGGIVYAEGDTTLAQAVIALLRERARTLATAESCTGGLVAELLTERAGASDVFRGSIVAYDVSVKRALLGVDPSLLETHGAVSEEVARAMATGARRALAADFALAVTGVAGPDGGTEQEPVGLVHYAVAHPGGIVARHALFPHGGRRQIQMRAAFAGLSLIREILLGAPQA